MYRVGFLVIYSIVIAEGVFGVLFGAFYCILTICDIFIF